MSIDAQCDEAQERLTDAAFEGREVSKADRLHTDECERCRAHRADLVALTQMLDFTPPLSVERAAAVRRNVALELTRSAPDTRRATAGADLPREYPRELARILAWAAIPLPLVLFIYLQLSNLMLGKIGDVEDLPPPEYPEFWAWVLPLIWCLIAVVIVLVLLPRRELEDEVGGGSKR